MWKKEQEVLERYQSFFKLNNTKVDWSVMSRSNPSKITDLLYLGTLSQAVDVETLEKNGISAVLSLVHGECTEQHELYSEDIKFLGFAAEGSLSCLLKKQVINYHYLQPDDPDYNIEEHFEESINFLRKNEIENRKTLVHCRAGVSRSASIVVVYLITSILTNKLSIHDLEKRIATTNPDFSIENLKYHKNEEHSLLEPNEENALKLLLFTAIYVFTFRSVIDPNEGFLIQIWRYCLKHENFSQALLPF